MLSAQVEDLVRQNEEVLQAVIEHRRIIELMKGAGGVIDDPSFPHSK